MPHPGSLLKDRTFNRQFVSYFILFITAISVIGIINYCIAINIITDQSEKFHVTITDEVKQNIDSRFSEIRKVGLQLINTNIFNKIMNMQPHIDYSRVTVLDVLNMTREITNYKLINNFLDEIFVYFANDNIVMSSQGKEDAETFFGSMFKMEGTGKFDEKILRKNLKSPLVMPNMKFTYLGRKYDSLLQIQNINSTGTYEHDTQAAVITVIGKKSIEDILENIKSKGDYNLYIIDENNTIVAGSSVDKNSRYFNDYFRYMGRNCVLKGSIDKMKYIFYHASSNTNKWEYIAVIPINVIAKKAEYFRNVFIFVFVVAIMLGLVCVLFLTRKSLYPLRKIVSLVDKLNNPLQQSFKSDFELIENFITNLREEKNIMQVEMEKYSFMLKNSQLLRLVKGSTTYDAETATTLANYGIVFPHDSFKVSVFEIEYIDENDRKSRYIVPEFLIIIRDTLDKILSELQYTGYVFEIELNRVLVLLNIDHSRDTGMQSGISQILKKIKEEIEYKYNIVLTVGSGNVYNFPEGIRYSFDEAVYALNYKLLLGKSSVIEYNEIINRDGYSYHYPMEKELNLIRNLKSADYASVEKILGEIIDENLYKRHLDFNIARCLFFDLEATALKALQEINLSIYNNQVVSRDLSLLNTFDEMIAYIKMTYNNVCEIIRKKNEHFKESLVKDIINDIEENYRDSNFSLNMCARKYGLSNSHMSRFFKEKTGFYFSDFLNKRRIDAAKHMLKTTNLAVKDIAREIGYINDITFRRIFKRYELITPMQLRDKNNAG